MYNTSTTNPIFTRHAGDQRSAVLSLTSHRTTSWWRWDLWRQMNFSLRDDKVVNRIENRSNGVEKLHLSSVSLLESDTVCVCESCVSCVCLRKWWDEMLVKGNRLAHGCFPPTTSHYFHLRQTNALSTLASFRNLIMKCHKHTNKQTNKQTQGHVNQSTATTTPQPRNSAHITQTHRRMFRLILESTLFYLSSFLSVSCGEGTASWTLSLAHPALCRSFSGAEPSLWCNKDVLSLTGKWRHAKIFFYSWICGAEYNRTHLTWNRWHRTARAISQRKLEKKKQCYCNGELLWWGVF